ncbi:MAG: GNAT family N-acetyltransferase [Anaerolineae bacterium]|jgi:GNAT superfamily N-acetyltransferase|nr:GNAT family N-acetyltransferase [Anaerolineae bacterium]
MIRFAKATPADAPALTEVQTRTFDDDSRRFLGRPSGGPPGYDSVAWQIKTMQQAAYYKILVDEQVVGGFIVFNMGRGSFILGRIYVDPDFQDQGIGTQAMQHMESLYPQAKQWALGTPGWATRNHHFYEKLGYIKVREDVEEDGGVGFWYKKQVRE